MLEYLTITGSDNVTRPMLGLPNAMVDSWDGKDRDSKGKNIEKLRNWHRVVYPGDVEGRRERDPEAPPLRDNADRPAIASPIPLAELRAVEPVIAG